MEQTFLVEQVNRLFSEAFYVHRFATHEMLYLAFDLRRAACLIRATPSGFAFHTHQLRAALGANTWKTTNH